MECSGRPAPHLVNGLRRLVDDIRRSDALWNAGLTDVVCGHTQLLTFSTDGVCYSGHPVRELIEHRTFEQVVWLLLNREFPTDEELADCCAVMNDQVSVDRTAAAMITSLPMGTRPLDLVPLGLFLLSLFESGYGDGSPAAGKTQIWKILAQIPILVSEGFLNSRPADPSISELRVFDQDGTELTFAGRLLWQVRGTQRPTPHEDYAMNCLMICQCLTEMRPACFSARLTASSTPQLSTALQMAATIFTSQLRNDPYLWTSELLRGLHDPGQAEAWWRRREGQPMPFGFAEQSEDNRSALLLQVCHSLLGSLDRIRVAAVAARIEKLVETEQKFPTVDWASAKLMTLLNIPAERQALVIAVARMAGWGAQAIEQQSSGVSLLPALRYGNL